MSNIMEKTARSSPVGRRATAKEVAELAGVSISAVSRAFTEGASVSPKTREKVLAATKALGYQPNALARSLMTRRTELIGLVADNFNNPAFMEIFDLFARKLQQRGLRPLIANLSEAKNLNGALEMLLQYSVDGVIVASSSLPSGFVRACKKVHIPVVHAFGRPVENSSVSVVGADNFQGGRLAADLLLERGYRKIAFLGGPERATSTIDRLKGLTAGLVKSHLKPEIVLFSQSFSHESGFRGMQELLESKNVEAVFCGDDIIAMGAIDACRERGVGVPAEVGILGFNDIAMASWSAYNLTTIRQPISSIIEYSVEFLLKTIDELSRRGLTRTFECVPVVRGTLRLLEDCGKSPIVTNTPNLSDSPRKD